MSSDEAQSDGEQERKAKHMKPSLAGGSALVVAKAKLTELIFAKKQAVKVEDYAEAMRLKLLIDEATAEIESLKAKPKAAPKAPKREHSDEGGQPTKTVKTEIPRKPRVMELAAEPFFDDARPERLMPLDVTMCEREAIRAVQTGNATFLSDKLIGRVPLVLQRDIVSKQTALHLAIEKGDPRMISTLVKEITSRIGLNWHPRRCSQRMTSLQEQGTGEMSVLTLGFATGKVGAARGGKEMNNALLDPDDPPEPLHQVISRSPLKADQVKLLHHFGLLTRLPAIRRGKMLKSNRPNQNSCDALDACVEPAVTMGNLTVLRALLELIDSAYGVTDTHRAAVAEGPLPEKTQGRSILATMRVGGELSPVHFASVNPDASKLQAMLKREPEALTKTAPSGLQPIHVAAACSGPEPLRLLLSDWHADRKTQGPHKRTPLHYAAAAGRAEGIRLLMGGAGGGPGASVLFTKEIRALLGRQSGSALKIGNDGILILSQLLTDVLRRISSAAQRFAGEGRPTGPQLHAATNSVLKGAKLARHIVVTAQKAAGSHLGLAEAAKAAALSRSLSDLTEDALQDMFKAIDENGDGHLDKAEVKKVFDRCDIKLGSKAHPKIWKALDTENSGRVTFEQFSSWMEEGSSYAKNLRRGLLTLTDMAPAALAEAEGAEDTLKNAKFVFDATALAELHGLLESGDRSDRAKAIIEYISAILDCVGTKVLEFSANAARSQSKTAVTADHIMTTARTNEELKGLYALDSVVMNSVLLGLKDKDGRAAIHCAAEHGHVGCVEMLIACGADVNVPGPDRKPAVSLAAERGHDECVRLLLKAGAKLEQGDKRARTPLLLAVRAGRAVAASILLHHGANANAQDDSGNTVAHYAAAFGWIECVDLLHEAGADLSTANQMKLAPITAALQKGHRGVFRRLLELGIDVNFRDADGSTLLISCLSSASRMVLDEVQFMLSKGADPSLASAQGTTVLHRLATAGLGDKPDHTCFAPHASEEARLAKLAGWSARPKLPGEEKPTEDEEEDEDSDEAEEEKGKKEDKKESAQDQPMPEQVYERGFHHLTNAEREAVFRLGWNQQAWQRGDNPTTPWSKLNEQQQHAAQTLGLDDATWSAAVLPVRVATGVRIDGKIPFTSGMVMGHNTMSYGEVSVQIETPTGSTAILVHISRVLLPEEDEDGKFQHVTSVLSRLLVEKGVSPDTRDRQGKTPLMYALEGGKADLALVLLELGADPNATMTPPAEAGKPPPQAVTPLMCASRSTKRSPQTLYHGTYGIIDAVRALINKGVEINAACQNKDSPLILFLQGHQDYQTARVLLDAGAPPVKDKRGLNALHLSFRRAFEDPAALAFALHLLKSESGATLATELSTTGPGTFQVTPLYSLAEVFCSFSAFSTFGPATPQMLIQQAAEKFVQLVEAIPVDDLSKWVCLPEGVNIPGSPLSFACKWPHWNQTENEMGKKVVTLLFKRGVSPNAVGGCEPALHMLVPSMGHLMVDSPLVQALLPLTDLSARMADGHTLLTQMMAKIVGNVTLAMDPKFHACIESLLQAKCDPNQPSAKTAPQDQSLCQPLHYAAVSRNERLLDLLLRHGADPTALTRDSRSPLHFAVMAAPTGSNSNFDAEECLLRAGADISARDKMGRNVLHYAFLKLSDGALEFTGYVEEKVQGKSTYVHWTHKAHKMLQTSIDPVETISSICAVGGLDVNVKDNAGASPLHLAALRGASISALKLAHAGAVLEESFCGSTPLGLAMQNHPSTAVLILQLSPDTTKRCRLIGPPGQSFAPPLDHAESIFSLAIRQVSAHSRVSSPLATSYLGAAVSVLDKGFPRSEALSDTISSGEFVMLLTLIPKVGDEVLRTQRFAAGQSVLHRLCGAPMPTDSMQRDAMLRTAHKLLDRRVVPDTDDNQVTPLHLAAETGFAELVEIVLERTLAVQELVNVSDHQGVTALGRAFTGGSETTPLLIAAKLIAKGAHTSSAKVNGEGESLVMHCVKQQYSLSSGFRNGWPEVLFTHEAPDLLMQDVKGMSCLMHAALLGHAGLPYLRRLVQWAIESGTAAKLFALQDKNGMNALMHAVSHGHTIFSEELLYIASRVSPEVVQKLTTAECKGGTALSLAVQSSDATGGTCVIMRWMEEAALEKAMSVVDETGQTPLSRAVLLNRLPVARVLLEGRPLLPVPTKTTCPAGQMAGNKVVVCASYQSSREGAPSYHIRWLTAAEIAEHVRCSLKLGFPCSSNHFELTLPPGTGPGIEFTIDWSDGVGEGSAAGPGVSGAFAGRASPRTPAVVLRRQDSKCRSVLHCCVAPLSFGSFENTEMLELLLKAGVPVELRDVQGSTAVELAALQRSGCMHQVFRAQIVGIEAVPSVPLEASGDWPMAVDVGSDCDSSLAAAEAKIMALCPAPAPLDSKFMRPSANSDCVVANGADGLPLDLTMTKVDVSLGPYGQNVFYRMQVIHERNQDNYIIFTKWGRIGDVGQFQTTPKPTLKEAETEFCKIFKSKAGNEWAARDDFVKKPGKYQLHTMKYSTTKPADALNMASWKRLPVTETPFPLQRLLETCTERGLLARVLTSANIDQPLGLLKRQPLAEALELLYKIKPLVRQANEERSKASTSGDTLQKIADEIAAASSRVYELVPTRNFKHDNAPPIDQAKAVKQWIFNLNQTDDIACAARILLGAQAKIDTISPVDYMYRALGMQLVPLPHDSVELQLLEQYICRSQPQACLLFTGEGAQELPKLQPGQERPLKWQAIRDARCCTANGVDLPLVACAGNTFTQLALSEDGTRVLIKKNYSAHPEVWVPTRTSDGAHALTPLTEREALSPVASIYRAGHHVEQESAGTTLLFHGSGLANCLAILSQGLRVQPPGAVQHGAAFGNGVYFANTFAKSRNYCSFHHGVGFMLLSEVSLGKTLKCKGDFATTVANARIAVAREALGVGPEVKPADHPELKKVVKEIQEAKTNGDIEDLSGTGFDSLHVLAASGPDPAGSIVHPLGTLIPSGEITPRGEPGNTMVQRDELIVYETSRSCIRYVIELRSTEEPTLLVSPLDTAGGETPAAEPSGETAEDDQDEDDDDEEEDEDEEGEDVDDDE